MGSEPTVITKDGTQFWKNDKGELHREDGPAIICQDGRKEWWYNGKLHREDGPAVFYPDGRQFWFINDERHREDGPAEIYPDGAQFWYINGKLHREDGPARIYSDGEQYWYINGHDITGEIKKWANERDIDLDNSSDIDKMVIKLEWGNYGK